MSHDSSAPSPDAEALIDRLLETCRASAGDNPAAAAELAAELEGPQGATGGES